MKKILKSVFVIAMALTVCLSFTFTFSSQEAYAASKPGKVSGISKSYSGHYEYKVTWEKASNAKKYQVYRSTKKDGTYKRMTTTTSRSYKAYVIPGKTYYYKVRAINGSKKGSFSSKLLVKTASEKQLASDIPVYWNEEINDALKKYEEADGNSTFMYLTDAHWNANTKHSPAIVNYLYKKEGFNLVAFGGDVIEGTKSTTKAAINEIKSFYGSFDEDVNLMATTGNHDYDTSGGDVAPLTDKKMYELIYKKEKSFATVAHYGRCAYTDDTANKVRYISFYFDAALDNVTPQMGSNSKKSYPAQYELDWLKKTIQDSSLDEDWTIVLFTHGYYDFVRPPKEPTATKTGSQVGDFLLELQSDENTRADIACWMVGHTHKDKSTVISDDNGQIRIICTCTDSYMDGSNSRGTGYWGGCIMKKGHDTEQVIDMIRLDTENKKIHLIRVGAGEDRDYTY